MTGPRSITVHPHRRRGRRLLPFLIAIALAPMACTSDQPTEPMASGQESVAAASGAHPRALLHGGNLPSMLATAFPSRTSRSTASLTIASMASSGSKSVLILADADVASTTALQDTLTQAGFQVTVRPAPEDTWDGTNPSLTGFDAVIHLNGAGFAMTLPETGQQALNDFVANGGGYIGAQWNGNEYTPFMADLVLQNRGGDADAQNCADCQVRYDPVSGQEGHPVLAGLSSGFTFTADAHDAGTPVETVPSIVLMQLPNGRAGVLVRDYGSGKVVNFSFAPNYSFLIEGDTLREPTTLKDSNIKKLYINAARWVSGSAAGQAEPQTIDFASLSDKVYGQPAFTVQANASSGLPVSFTAAGDCSIVGSTVSILAAGSCTITAHQAGNANYLPAEDVSQSFNIAKATPVINWTPASLLTGTPLGPSQLNASATGIGGVLLTGDFAYNPPSLTTFDVAGPVSLSVQFTPRDPNYTGASKTVSISVSGSMNFSGFYAPLRNMPTVNTAMAGSAIPVKFAVGGYRGLRVLGVNSPTSVQVDCPVGAPENHVRPLIAGSSGLKSVGYSYTYVWKTNAGWGGTCRKFVLTLADGSIHEALFRFVSAPRVTTVKRILGQ